MADGSVTIDTKLDESGLKKGLSTIGSISSKALKGIAVATGVVATAFAGVVTASVKARGEIEQQIGGVNKIFGDASEELIANANKAYKTAGISATKYMEQATSFSASLMQATGNNASETARIADMALIDMADNANTFGTSIESLQSAYQGFAKQNYTMLDNLKLGYGGTKTEMERLLKDAQEFSGIEYNIDNLADVYNAIHVIQEQMQIAGTTGKEATATLQGSLGMLKASWENFLSGSGNLGQVIESVNYTAQNIMRIVSEAMPDIIENIVDWMPEFMKTGGELLQQIANGILDNLPMIMETALTIVTDLIKGIINMLPKIIETGVTLLVSFIEGIAKMIPELIPLAVDCLMTIVETLLDNIDAIIDAGIELIIALALGLIEALPRLIDKIPVIIDKLVNAITRNLPKIIGAGVVLIIKLAEGLIQAIPHLLSAIPQIISSLLGAIGSFFGQLRDAGRMLLEMLVNGISAGIGKMAEIGSNIVKGLWNGISNVRDWLFNKIKGFKDAVLNKFKSFFGIHSPSKLFKDEIGQNLAFGIGEGFEDNISKTYDAMQRAVDIETSKLSTGLTASNNINVIRNANITSTLDEINTDREITVNAITNLDGKVLTRTVNTVNARQRLAYGIGG